MAILGVIVGSMTVVGMAQSISLLSPAAAVTSKERCIHERDRETPAREQCLRLEQPRRTGVAASVWLTITASLMKDHWERQAQNWLRWARTPGFDAYWLYSPIFFDEIVPSPGHATLEIGCGEGRVTRDLKALGHDVVAIDTSPTLLAAARELDPVGDYREASAEELPFANGAFDLVVAYNSLMDVDDMPKAVGEASRVLQPEGRFAICVTHPLADAGRFQGTEPDAPFLIEGSYLGSSRFEGTFTRDGLTMEFAGWTHDLEHYSQAFQAAGLLIDRLREPADPKEEASRWKRIPNFLFIRCLKPL